jgi:tripartite-type tricarboxylate transporter receptor subunit TctC
MNRLTCCAILAALLLPVAAQAQYPTRPISLVVGYSPGGIQDIAARVLAKNLSEKLSQPVIVINRPGSDGMLAALSVRDEAPDGYTLMIGSTSLMVVNPLMAQAPARPYDAGQFLPLGRIGFTPPLVLVTRNDLPIRSFADFRDYLKRHPTTYAVGGSLYKITAKQLLDVVGATAVCVPYHSGPQEIQDLLAKTIDWMFMFSNVAQPLVNNGDISALMVLSSTRTALLPNVPSAQEAGADTLTPEPWIGLFGPRDLPRDVVSIISTALKDTLADQRMIAGLEALNIVVGYADPDGLRETIRRQSDQYSRMNMQQLCNEAKK